MDDWHRILSFDGGPAPALGVRLLEFVELAAPGFLDRTEVFAGNSNGSFTALYLAAKVDEMPATQAISTAVEFSNDLAYAFHAGLCDTLRLIGGYGPLNLGAQVRKVTEQYLGTLTLGQLAERGRRVALMSYDQSLGRPKLFTNFEDSVDGIYDPNQTLVDVALSSAATPLFFPIHGSQATMQRYVDGYVVANNPTMAAVARVVRSVNRKERDLAPQDCLKRVMALSIGARQTIEQKKEISSSVLHDVAKWARPTARGSSGTDLLASLADAVFPLTTTNLYWGWWQWILVRPFYLMNIMMQAPVSEVSSQASELLGQRYFHRLNPDMKQFVDAAWVFFGPTGALIQGLDAQAMSMASSDEVTGTIAWVKRTWNVDLALPVVAPADTAAPPAAPPAPSPLAPPT